MRYTVLVILIFDLVLAFVAILMGVVVLAVIGAWEVLKLIGQLVLLIVVAIVSIRDGRGTEDSAEGQARR